MSVYKYSTGSVTNATLLYHISNGCNTIGKIADAIGVAMELIDINSKLQNMKQKKNLIENLGRARISDWVITPAGKEYLEVYKSDVQLGGIKLLPFRKQTTNNVNSKKPKQEPEPNLSSTALEVLDSITPILDTDSKLNDLISSLLMTLNSQLLVTKLKEPKLEAGLMLSVSKVQLQNAQRINKLIDLSKALQEY